MQLETTRFGTIEIDPGLVITLTQPILGFQEYRRFILLPGPNSALRWLQSTESGSLAFILMDPRAAVPDYAVELSSFDLSELAATTAEELDVFTLVVVPADQSQIRTNLKAPILINPKHRLGKQVIMDNDDYPIQFFLGKAASGTADKEVPNARSHA